MSKSLSRIIATAAWLCLPAHAANQAPNALPKQAGEFETMVSLEVGANGQVIRVMPEPSLQDAISGPLKARVSQWKFEAPTYQGRPVQADVRLQLRLQLAPTTAGGYGVRIVHANISPPLVPGDGPGMRFVGHPPKENVTLVYVVSIDAEGRNSGLELALPKKRSRAVRVMDESTRFSLQHAPPLQRTVDGHAVACRMLFTMKYIFGEGPAPDYTAESKAISDTLTDKCPTTRLLTEVAGTTL